ncbi:heavy-metal-associated domain-containing protein [Candidatus Gottesmanbacteria bacterium]|nr:heavy-metal-associated domain-containing protein [Candidatus Gottesmanbacteria bacterium]
MSVQTFTLTGLTCQACKKITEKRIGTLPGVFRVEVTVADGSVRVESADPITNVQINEVLSDTPYFIEG